ncbi:MAG: glycosyltransferase family 39 protein, partial [Pseudomonadota bacterium]
MTAVRSKADTPYLRWAVILIGGMLLFRLLMLLLSASGLHGDEAQYWAWSREPDFGYYSKPPLIAWVIWITTSLFGHEEWAVRLASPFLHTGTAILTYLSASRLFDQRAGLIASALYILMPGVALSASLISTDAALLLFVALFIHSWIRLREQASWGWALMLGAALGLGLMAKYAMIYILPAFSLALLFDIKTRHALLDLKGLAAAGMTMLIITPNLIWNQRNSFATLQHTTDNANMGDGVQLNPLELVEFLVGQLGVFGPVTFILLIIALWRVRQNRDQFRLWLCILILTPLLVICVQALLSRANANWAAAAYGAAPLLLAGWALRSRRAMRWVMAGLSLNLLMSLVPPLVLMSPSLTDQLGFANAVKRQRGWPDTVDAIAARYGTGDFDAIAVDNRLMFYALTYYGMEDTAPLFMWRYEPRLNNHAEMTRPLPEDDRSVLLISYYPTYADYFARDFDRLTRLGEIEIELGGGKSRALTAYAAQGYKGPVPRE